MNLSPVVALLAINAALLAASGVRSRREEGSSDALPLSLLFFCSGMPALIYQIVWERALFAIYGVNAQSVAVVVTAFMLGLGAGSLAGGWLATRFPKHSVLIFGLAETSAAVFGLASLRIFHWIAAYTAGANLPWVILFSLLLLLVPTTLMGATLPLLVEHLVLRTRRVGASVSLLYSVNTFGSAVACFLCAAFLLRDFGQSGSVSLAACMNAGVGGFAYLYARGGARPASAHPGGEDPLEAGTAGVSFPLAVFIAGLTGFIALGFEIAWYRVFAVASSDRAPAFALLLCTYLAGIAAGSLISEKLVAWLGRAQAHRMIGGALLLAGASSVYIPPLTARLMAHGIPFLMSAPAFFVVAALAGSVLPLLCGAAISADEPAGRRVSFVYMANILGSAFGSLGIGFILMQYFGLLTIAFSLAFLAVLAGGTLLLFGKGPVSSSRVWALAAIAGALVAIPASKSSYSLLYERLIFGTRAEARVPFAHVVENRNGVIAVTRDGAVFGGGVYDGYFNTDPTDDVNLVIRAYALSAFCPAPKSVLMIGLSSGSWAQIIASEPQIERFDTVEINPGYLQLIPLYPMVRTFLKKPNVRIYVDDGRRWLEAHPGARYDAIVANTTYNWRDHSTGLLSVEYLKLIREHLNEGGVYYFNSTESDDTMETALHVFPYGLRVINCLAVSDTPITIDRMRWMQILRDYRIDGKPVFDPASPAAKRVLDGYLELADRVNEPPRFVGMEATNSLRSRLKNRLIITDDNMGEEWRSAPPIPWH